MCFRKVGAVGFEPTTFCVSDRYSNQLSYTPVYIKKMRSRTSCNAPLPTKPKRFSIQPITNHRFLITSYPIICNSYCTAHECSILHPLAFSQSFAKYTRSAVESNSRLLPKNQSGLAPTGALWKKESINCTSSCIPFSLRYFSASLTACSLSLRISSSVLPFIG